MANKVGTNTGQKTSAGKDVYKTPEGESVSEKSVTIKFGENAYVNAPSIYKGKRYTEDEVKEMLLEGIIKPTSRHDTLEKAIEAAETRSDNLLKDGGMAKRMAKQMELFEPVERGFDEGGLMEEGGMVDEVSGNDVPPGSLRTEVRDDIPAQLSEGEFVFPADVVRYIGLENLMRMRQEAKQGLAQMEAMGQMGNSEEATIEDNLPFDMYDLDVDDEDEYNNNMAVGGMPTKDQTRQAFQLGGTVQLPGFTGMQITQPTAPTTGYRPYVEPVEPVQAASSQFVPQFTGVQYTTATGTTNIPTFAETVGRNPGQYDELRTYVNDAGQTLRIPFKNGQPIYPIPYGYKYQAEETTTPTDTSTVPTTVVGQDDDRGGDGNYGVGVGSATVTGASDMESAMMDASRGRFGTGVSSVGTYGGNREFGFSNPEMRSATFNMAKAQLGSLSPMAAAGIAIGNQLGILDNMSTPNQDAIAGQTAKGMALGMMGYSDPGQISTNEQATAYGLAISAAMEASKKGQDVRAAVNAVMEQNQKAVQQGQVSAMTDLGYSASDVSNQASVSRAVAGYNALADAYDTDATEVAATGTVKDSKGNPVMSKSGPVMTQSSRDALNALQSKAAQARAAAKSLSNLEMNLDRSRSSGTPSFDADTGAPSDGFGPGTGGYSSEDAAAAADVAGHDGDTGPGGSGDDHGADAAGSTGAGTGTDCLTEDMKVKLNGVIDFVTNIKVGDMIDNYKVKEVLHKHMRSGYYSINNELKISNDHPVLANGTWTRPEDLVVGDNINGIPVTSLEYVERMTPTVSIVIDGESFDVHTENNIYTVHGRYREVRQEAA
jgi:hypothetical protein